MRRVAILGATGSIGRSTLDVIRRHPERFEVVALTANTDVDGMREMAREFRPRLLAMADHGAAAKLAKLVRRDGLAADVGAGAGALEALAADPGSDTVMAAIVGAAGLLPTIAATRAGKRVLLANKEALVVAGELLIETACSAGAELLPIDSEHNAVFQCLPADHRAMGQPAAGVRRIVLTASGGPFRDWSERQLEAATPEQACNHPNWDMGRKISVDSATLMNKGLEVIEAHYLFGSPVERIEVVVHRQSIVHSMVEYDDGSVLAQMGNPDMRTPIAHALGWPERIESGVAPLDLMAANRFDFEAPDLGRFPCLKLAYQAASAGGKMPAVLNAANEVAVKAFLDGRSGFMQISDVIARTMAADIVGSTDSVDALLAVDRQARARAEHYLRRKVS